MAVRCRVGILKPFEQEIIMKGDQTVTIRRMLKDKQFAVVKLPDIEGKYPYQVWIYGVSICAIREQGSDTPYRQCNRYLCIDDKKEEGEDNGKDDFKERLEFVFRYSEMPDPDAEPDMEYPDLDDFLTSMADKELVFGGYYTDDGGDTEYVYRKFFFDMNLKLRTSSYRPVYNVLYDIRFYLTSAGENEQSGMVSEDIRNLDVNSAMLEYMNERTKGYCYNNPRDFSLVFEAQSEMAQSSCFLRCFYGCYDDDEHPTGILCYRFSAFVLPGKASKDALTDDKCVVNTKDGTKYLMDQIQINSEICRSISELKDWIDYDLNSVAED